MADRDFLVNQTFLNYTPNHSQNIKPKPKNKSVDRSIFNQSHMPTQTSYVDYSDVVRDQNDQIQTVKTLKNIFLDNSNKVVRKP